MKKTKATSKPKSTKNLKEEEKLKKENLEKQQKEQNFKRLEDYLNESGLSLAFNIAYFVLLFLLPNFLKLSFFINLNK